MAKDQITLRDIYDAVGKLEEKIDKRISKGEERIESLESFRDRSLGIISIVSVIVGGVFTWIWKKVLPV